QTVSNGGGASSPGPPFHIYFLDEITNNRKEANSLAGQIELGAAFAVRIRGPLGLGWLAVTRTFPSARRLFPEPASVGVPVRGLVLFRRFTNSRGRLGLQTRLRRAALIARLLRRSVAVLLRLRERHSGVR